MSDDVLMDAHTLELLEFNKVRELLAGYAASSLGKDLAGTGVTVNSLLPGGACDTDPNRLPDYQVSLPGCSAGPLLQRRSLSALAARAERRSRAPFAVPRRSAY